MVVFLESSIYVSVYGEARLLARRGSVVHARAGARGGAGAMVGPPSMPVPVLRRPDRAGPRRLGPRVHEVRDRRQRDQRDDDDRNERDGGVHLPALLLLRLPALTSDLLLRGHFLLSRRSGRNWVSSLNVGPGEGRGQRPPPPAPPLRTAGVGGGDPSAPPFRPGGRPTPAPPPGWGNCGRTAGGGGRGGFPYAYTYAYACPCPAVRQRERGGHGTRPGDPPRSGLPRNAARNRKGGGE